MSYFLLKVLVSALVVAGASELARRDSVAAAVLLSLPLVTILAMTWLYVDTGDTKPVAALARDVLWLIPPSMALLVAMPPLLERGVGYWWALVAGMALTVASYALIIGIRRGLA